MDNLPDPSTLTDEELDKALEGELPEPPQETPDATPPAEEPVQTPEPDASEQEEETEEQEGEGEEPDVEEEPKPPSRREQLRIQQLLQKMQQPQEQPAAKPVPDALDYRDALDADDETLSQLEQDRQASNQAFYQQGIQQAQAIEWRTMLHIDSPQVEAAHPQLNPKDEANFHPALANAVNDWYLQTSQFDNKTGMAHSPGVRYKDFVDGIFELAEEIAATKVQSSTKNIAKQAAKTGLRPDGSSAKRLNLNKAPEDMTDEELEAVISRSLPKR
jgi:hypothetical protein